MNHRKWVQTIGLSQLLASSQVEKVSIRQKITSLGTLLNRLFQTNFNVMNGNEGRSQTTKGLWMTATRNDVGTILVFDVEGTDSHERGE